MEAKKFVIWVCVVCIFILFYSLINVFVFPDLNWMPIIWCSIAGIGISSLVYKKIV